MTDLTRSSITASSVDIQQAASILESGGLVAFPTETVYGLGADAENPAAIAKIFGVKGRPVDHPLIVHLALEADVGYWAQEIPEEAKKLIAAFWPGPLTLILKRAARIPAEVAGGQDTIGLRCPSHPVAQALLREFKQGKGGIAAPSANRFGHVSPTTAQHVRDEFGEEPRIGAILDGGQSEVGIESTILDLSRIGTHGPVLLRPGRISTEDIAKVLGVSPTAPDSAAPRASGTLDAHYAPRTSVAIVSTEDLRQVLRKFTRAGRLVVIMSHSPMIFRDALSQITLPDTPEGYAHELYAALRALDDVHADLILVEAPPSAPEWDGINDRLRRAVHGTNGRLDRFLQSAL